MNRLADETSPYLRQHADNPVDWYPWGDEAFDPGPGAEDKPDPAVGRLLGLPLVPRHGPRVVRGPRAAAVMNELFVNIKVDREERPDVDAIYMEAVQAMTGRGGWPMTVFLTPDGRPFFGGTYFPRARLHGLLRQVSADLAGPAADIEREADRLADAARAKAGRQLTAAVGRRPSGGRRPTAARSPRPCDRRPYDALHHAHSTRNGAASAGPRSSPSRR